MNVPKPTVVVLGSGPIRIGQGIEFDYASVHCVRALRESGYEAVIINNNPETVSTDFDISDRLYFEPLTTEDVLHVLHREGWETSRFIGVPQGGENTSDPRLLAGEGGASPVAPGEGVFPPRSGSTMQRDVAPTGKVAGVITQFGGQTAINLARPLHDAGVPLLGTSADAIDLAEDRFRFEALLERLDIPRPAGRAVLTTEDAVRAARDVGYPVLVRPSYVLGGRAMEIVYGEDDLRRYMAHAVDIGGGHPILVDRYLLGKEAETDVIADGQGGVLLPGIMEHIERAGVHSGDSMAVYPPQTISRRTQAEMVDYATRLAEAIGVRGLMNIQFVIDDGRAYVIEVNPRASRTVPYLSKITGIPMVKAATLACLGVSLASQGYSNGLHPEGPCIAVKAPVFSFAKLGGVDINLGPEMKSTGEVLGIDTDFSRALYKAMVGAGIRVPLPAVKVGPSQSSEEAPPAPDSGGAREDGLPFSTPPELGVGGPPALLVTLADRDKEETLPIVRDFHALGFRLFATRGTAAFLEAQGLAVTPVLKISEGTPNLLDLIKSGDVSLLLNTVSQDKRIEKEAALIRRASVEHSVPCLTSPDTARALHTALSTRTHGEQFSVRTVDTYTMHHAL